jgi:hypothetical protein
MNYVNGKLSRSISIDMKARIIYYGTIVYLFTLVFEAPIRYILNVAGISSVIYLRDGFILLVLSAYFIKVSITGKINKIILITFFIILFHAVIAIYYLNNVFQILFGVKILLPIILGMLVYHIIESRIKLTKVFLSIFLFLAILGIYVNFFKEFPWEGMTYEVAGKTIEATRAWTTFGVKRIAGFARTSYGAAIQIIILSVFVITQLKSKLSLTFLWLLSGGAIILTTTRTMVVNYIVMSIFLIVNKIMPNFNKIYQKALIVPIMATVLLPIYSYLFYDSNARTGFFDNPLLFSLKLRMIATWPDVFDFLNEKGGWVLGRGIGGLGMSQLHFESNYYFSGDNLFVYSLVYFGIFSIVYFLFIYKMAQNIDLKNGLFYYLIILALFIFGITANVIEDGFFGFFIGLSLRYIWIKSCEKNQIKL